MAKDEGKNLGYHWRRSAGVYDSPDRPKDMPPGNANTLSSDVGGSEPTQPVEKQPLKSQTTSK